ncbi:hypothetical protein WKI65_28355 [Streptomyces sp. MS1.AVA.3]|uniref:hypothetical protein n=1 Tax=Streptomyces decoyicus TaxID=249567 RepID=UPI0030C541FE
MTSRPGAGAGWRSRRVEPTVLLCGLYRLTDLGPSLEVRLAVLRAWAEHHMAAIDAARQAALDRAAEG